MKLNIQFFSDIFSIIIIYSVIFNFSVIYLLSCSNILILFLTSRPRFDTVSYSVLVSSTPYLFVLLSLSSTEAEYIALTEASQEALLKLFADFDVTIYETTKTVSN